MVVFNGNSGPCRQIGGWVVFEQQFEGLPYNGSGVEYGSKKPAYNSKVDIPF
jgi:hypothetical protein